MSKRHPHIEYPTDEQIAAVLQDKSDAIRDLFLKVHRLMLLSKRRRRSIRA